MHEQRDCWTMKSGKREKRRPERHQGNILQEKKKEDDFSMPEFVAANRWGPERELLSEQRQPWNEE